MPCRGGLARTYYNCAAKYPSQDHFIVAHSHGGNVVLYALRDQTVADSVRGVVCLSTPFIHCRERDLGPAGFMPIFVLALIAIGVPLTLGIQKVFPSVHLQIALLAASALTAGVVAGLRITFDFFLTRRFSVPDVNTASEQLRNSLRLAALPQNLLVVRAAGDEASAALATSHFEGTPHTDLGFVVQF